MKGHHRFGIKGKLAPRYIGPFKVTKQVGPVAYQLALPPELSGVHNVFHVSMLRKTPTEHTPTIDWSQLDLREDMSYEEQPVQILDRKVQKLRNKEIPLVKIRWKFHDNEELTWEREDYMKEHFPDLFKN